MTPDEYMKATRRTWRPVAKREQMLNAALGLAGEGGEVADLVKKHNFQGHSLTASQVENELGDVLFYVARMADLWDLDLAGIMQANIDKLQARYPNGFDESRSRNRE